MCVSTRMLTRTSIAIILFLLSVGAPSALAQATAFTYQGRLIDGSNPADGMYDMQFKIFNRDSEGSQVGSTITLGTVQVTNGTFSVSLDFGAGVFTGAERYLEISLRPTGSPSARTVLTPRQLVTATPYALRSASAATADNATTATTATNATQLGGIASSGFIQNTMTQQAGVNFNIGGNGALGGTLSASTVNVTTQYDIGGFRVFSIAGAENVFAGRGAGVNNTGGGNAFFGFDAGRPNTTGFNNSFFGSLAGNASTTGNNNSFFGREAGRLNTTGFSNSFFGISAGDVNSTGFLNSFFGAIVGLNNTTGNSNSFFGAGAGGSNTTGSNNAFFGRLAGVDNQTGSNNTIIGSVADVGSGNLQNATAIGYHAQVDQSDSFVLGSINGVNGATANTKVGIGTTTPAATLHVTALTTADADNTARFAAPNIGPNLSHIHYGATGDWFIRSAATTGKVILQDSGGNVGVGTAAPKSKLHVVGGNIYIAQPNSLIITSPNGACWFITVNNSGVLSTNSTTCP